MKVYTHHVICGSIALAKTFVAERVLSTSHAKLVRCMVSSNEGSFWERFSVNCFADGTVFVHHDGRENRKLTLRNLLDFNKRGELPALEFDADRTQSSPRMEASR